MTPPEPAPSHVAFVVNGEERTAPRGASLEGVVAQVVPAGRPVAVEVDGQVVPRSAFADRVLSGGERIEIVTFVGGG
jgi:sulfur carrier protein